MVHAVREYHSVSWKESGESGKWAERMEVSTIE